MVSIKDNIVTWYIQNIIIPKIEIIDKPGFIVTTFTEKNKMTYLREFLLPEKLIELIEDEIVSKYGEKGRKTLYSIGKKFGYLYASLSNFSTFSEMEEKEFRKFAYFFVRYIGSVFAEWVKYKMDLHNKILQIKFKDYIVCSHNGKGYIMGDGGVAGIWAYVMEDKEIEGVQTKCQGRGDNICEILTSPSNFLQNLNIAFLRESNLFKLEFKKDYMDLNKIKPVIYAHNSLKNLLDSGFFLYRKGKIFRDKERFFPCESHLIYIIENEIRKLKDGEKLLFDVAFRWGYDFAKNNNVKEYKSFITGFFPALGFGDIYVSEKEKEIEFFITNYPWTVFSENSNYTIMRGLFSGIISYSLKKHVLIDVFESNIRKDFFVKLSTG